MESDAASETEEQAGLQALGVLLDGTSDDAGRQRAVQRLHEALVHPGVGSHLEGVFAARPLTPDERRHLESATGLVRDCRYQATFHLLRSLDFRQDSIQAICDAFDSLPGALFVRDGTTEPADTNAHRTEMREFLVRAGAFRALMGTHDATRASVADAAAHALAQPELRRSPQALEIFMVWVDCLQGAPERDEADARAAGEERRSREESDGYGADELNHISCAYDEAPPVVYPSVVRANLYLSLGNPSAALEDFDWLLAQRSNDLPARFGRARTLLTLGRPEEALSDYQQAFRQYDRVMAAEPRGTSPIDGWTHVEARGGRAACLLETGRFEEAEREYLVLSLANPDDFNFKLGRARALTALGHPEQALALLREFSPRRDGNHSWGVHGARAKAFRQLGNVEAAQAIHTLGIRFAPQAERPAFHPGPAPT